MEENILNEIKSLKSLIIRGSSGVLPKPEAAIYLGISESYLTKITSRKRINYYRPEGKMTYYTREDLDTYLLRNRTATSDELQDKATAYVRLRKKGGSK